MFIHNLNSKKMIKKNYFLAVIILIAGTMITGCNSTDNKIENAENKLQAANDNVSAAKQDLNNAIKDSLTEYQKFKQESNEKIAAFDNSISELKVKIAKEKKENKARYERKLAGLEQQNRNMKKDLEEFKEDGKEKWYSFKAKFNYDMDNLGTAIKGFFN
jgi:hypothetical protein